jgi:hypothetical protein
MNSHIDFRTLPNNVPSLCIPRVFSNWTETRIRRIFDDLGMGEIQRIDVVSKTTEKGEKFNRVFVHFKRWFANKNADMARERLLNGKEIKIVYDDPWFWKVSAYREVKKDNHHSDREERPRASIRFDDDREQAVAKGRPSERRQDDDRRPSQRPHEQALRYREEDRRPHEQASAKGRPQDRRQEQEQASAKGRPRNEKSKEFLDKELEKINPTIPESMRVQTPKTVVKADVGAEVGCGAVVYDMDVVNSTKRRKIVIKKDPVVQKVPLKIESEDGELSESEQPVGDGADGDGLANVRW